LPKIDPLKYQKTQTTSQAMTGDLFTLKLRYKQPEGDVSKEIQFIAQDSQKNFNQSSMDFKFASMVAAFGMILKGATNKGYATLDMVLEITPECLGNDRFGYRAEFLELVKKAKQIKEPK
jgi:Ca-activated chloride channel family protein